jgi:hypothetical protein
MEECGEGRGVRQLGKDLLEVRDFLECGAEGDEVAGVSGAGGKPAEGAFEVADGLEGGTEVVEEARMVQPILDDILALEDIVGVGEGLGEPVAEASGAHGGDGLVQGLEEAGGFGGIGVEGFEDFEVAEGGGVKDEEVCGLVEGEVGEVFDVAMEDLSEVMEDGAGGGGGGGAVAEAEAVEGGDLMMFAEGEQGGFGVEGVVVVGLEAAGGALELFVE